MLFENYFKIVCPLPPSTPVSFKWVNLFWLPEPKFVITYELPHVLHASATDPSCVDLPFPSVFLQPSISSSLLCPNFPLSTLLSGDLNLCSSFSVKAEDSHLYRTADKIVRLYVYFKFYIFK